MPVVRKAPPLPPSNIPVVDPRTGQMTRAWYEYFAALDALLREIVAAIP